MPSPAYKREEVRPSVDFVTKIKKVKIFFWTSLPQYKAYLKEFPFIEKAIHCCGIGKTYKKSLEDNLNLIPFSGMSEFKNWINEENKKGIVMAVDQTELFDQAKEFIPGGVHSPVRSFKGLKSTPRFITKGKGAYIWDVNGNNYIDFCMSFWALNLRPPK